MTTDHPQPQHDLFETSDYGVSGYLFACGYDHECLKREGQQVIFCFPGSPALTTAVSDYLSNRPIGARDLFHGLRRAKAIVQAEIQGRIRNYHAHHSSS